MQIVDETIAEVILVEDFRQRVQQGDFETEGSAFPCREEPQTSDADGGTVFTEDSSITINSLDDIPQWATHIAWYAK